MTHASTSPLAKPSERAIVLTRTFEAPATLVFEMWTRPEHLARWWGPQGFTTAVIAMDVRPRGRFRFVMRGPDGADHPVEGVYHEIVPAERVVFTTVCDDDTGAPMEALTTVTLEEHDGITTMTLHILCATEADRAAMVAMGAVEGWNSTLDRLADILANL